MNQSSNTLHELRNLIPIDDLIKNVLDLDFKYSEGHLRFICPTCCDRHTAINPKTNLARCFICQENYNPIDLYMKIHKVSFKQSVSVLLRLLPFYKAQRTQGP